MQRARQEVPAADAEERAVTDRVAPDMWVDPADDPRETSAGQPAGEKDTVWDYLRRYRLTIEMKCADLTPEQLASRSVPPSTMSLLGLVRHLARVEHHWFRRVLEGQDIPRIYRTDDDHDADSNVVAADADLVADAWASWRREVDHADRWLARCDDLDAEVPHGGGRVAVRDVLVHMVEEYARHAGHADLLRECIDGRTGQ
jgi:uncharacterized damage-inducible protein DinB